MKIILLFVIITLCTQIMGNEIVGNVPPTTSTPKPWRKKISDGLGKLFQGAAILGAIQQAIHDGKSSKHKSLHNNSKH